MALWRRILDWLFGSKPPSTATPSKPLTARKILGNKGEAHALSLLKKRGDSLVVRNWSCKSGELDLVTWHKETLVFTEVRTRSRPEFGTPAESVDRRKQEKLRRAAHGFLASRFRDGRLPPCRFDVVWIVARDSEIVESGIIEGAFF